MALSARYADGRAAIYSDATCELGANGLTIEVGGVKTSWTYDEFVRADDGNGRIVLKRKPDTGERLSLDRDAHDLLKAFEPRLVSDRAQGVESMKVVGGLVAGAWSTAAAFLIGVPLAAGPLADIMPPRVRDQIADISWAQVDAITGACDDADAAEEILNSLAHRMMERSNVAQRDDIWITIVDTDGLDDPFPNAFALPDQTIIVTDDLIALAEHPDEITGVLAHEIAHIERNHIMKGLIRSVGAGIFFDIVFGGAGAGQAIAIASVNLSGLRFSRDDETDADTRGLDYLDAAGISSGGLARLFERLETRMREEGGSIPEMLSSHPASDARAQSARARARTGLAPSLSDADWQVVRAACGGQPAATVPAPENAAPDRPL